MSSFTGRTAIAAAIGGTASEIGGGKFANGATSAAFVVMYNDLGKSVANSFIGFIQGMQDIERLHINRNLYNLKPDIEISQIDPNIDFIDNSGRHWIREPDWKNAFHGEGSVKYIHIQGKGSSEAILNNGNWVTSGSNQGTYNYYHPQGIKGNIGHLLFDVIPHFIISSDYQ
jgi:hypothetical protein